MAGRHAAPRPTWNLSRYFLPIVTALGVLALITTTVSAGAVLRRFSAGGYGNPPASEEAAVPTSPPKRSSPSRASRGEPDSAARSAPSVSPTPRPSRSASSPSTGDRVTSRGSCQASFYDQGKRTANGERFDPEALTAAHKSLPFDTRVRVTNPDNGKSVVVRINDRGPYVDGRCLDLSRAAFRAIASLSAGHALVKYEVLARR